MSPTTLEQVLAATRKTTAAAFLADLAALVARLEQIEAAQQRLH